MQGTLGSMCFLAAASTIAELKPRTLLSKNKQIIKSPTLRTFGGIKKFDHGMCAFIYFSTNLGGGGGGKTWGKYLGH